MHIIGIITDTQRDVEKAKSQVHSEEQHHVCNFTEEENISYMLLQSYW